MGKYDLLQVVLTFATLAGAIVVFVLNMLIRKEEGYLKRFQDAFLRNHDLLGLVFRYPPEKIDEIKDKRGELIRKLDDELSKYQEYCSRTLDDGNCKIYISHSVWDNILDISTAKIDRVRNMLKRYKECFKFVFGEESYAGKFYNEILERLQPEPLKWMFIIVVIFLVLLILLIGFTCVFSLIGFTCVFSFYLLWQSCSNMQSWIVISTTIFCIGIQAFLIKITLNLCKRWKSI